MLTVMIRTNVDVILNHILVDKRQVDPRELVLSGEALLARSYAKIYYRGGGWYAVSGYASDGSDTMKTVNAIKDLIKGAVLKEGGYYFDKVGEIVGTY